jgi:ABC-type nitrate/sulfonate/bicarbonate transport system permease component
LGIRIALSLTIVLTLLMEILTSIEGIGALMISAQRNFQSGQVYGLLVLVGLFGFVINNAFSIAPCGAGHQGAFRYDGARGFQTSSSGRRN